MNRTQIANYALGVIGATRITSLDDTNPNAAKCKSLLPVSEEHVLRVHQWPSHTTRAILPQVGTLSDGAPKAYGYVLPHAMRILGISPQGSYVIENGTLYTDNDTCTVVYVKPPTEDYADTHLAEAIALHLATRLAVDMADDLQKQATIKQEYESVLYQAKQIASDEASDGDESRAWWYP